MFCLECAEYQNIIHSKTSKPVQSSVPLFSIIGLYLVMNLVVILNYLRSRFKINEVAVS